ADAAHDERSAEEFQGDADGGETDDAAVPAFAGEDQHARDRVLDLLLRLLPYIGFDELPFRIHPIELRAQIPRRFLRRGGEEIDRRLRRREASRRVDARTDLEPHIYRS